MTPQMERQIGHQMALKSAKAGTYPTGAVTASACVLRAVHVILDTLDGGAMNRADVFDLAPMGDVAVYVKALAYGHANGLWEQRYHNGRRTICQTAYADHWAVNNPVTLGLI